VAAGGRAYGPAVEVFAAQGSGKGKTGRGEQGTGLAAMASGLSERSRIHRKHRTQLAAVAGVTILHPVVLPTPRPLPPQRLVELLKHPFCVREARRAVFDALEFTYDRPFADLWEFVAFAETEHPELALLTPPKRPDKR
jgi:hypothetical protein